jgi:hypothetical protein
VFLVSQVFWPVNFFAQSIDLFSWVSLYVRSVNILEPESLNADRVFRGEMRILRQTNRRISVFGASRITYSSPKTLFLKPEDIFLKTFRIYKDLTATVLNSMSLLQCILYVQVFSSPSLACGKFFGLLLDAAAVLNIKVPVGAILSSVVKYITHIHLTKNGG